jgi:hypothetical protein
MDFVTHPGVPISLDGLLWSLGDSGAGSRVAVCFHTNTVRSFQG